jgi:hypothetical protein
MNSREVDILRKIVEDLLSSSELRALKSQVTNESGYNSFLTKLLDILIGREKGVLLSDFLNLFSLSEHAPNLQEKFNLVIEDLAERSFNGENSEAIGFLKSSGNEPFKAHLEFLLATKSASATMGRSELKKKLGQLDELAEFELSDEEISAAVHTTERKRLKGILQELDAKLEHKSRLVSINFREVLKYAAIVLAVVGSGYFLYNTIGKPDKQFADKNPKVISDSTLNQTQDTLKLPEAEQFSIERKILEAPSYGYAQRDEEKVKIILIDVYKQIAYLKAKCAGGIHVISVYGSGPKGVCDTLDFLINRNGTYIYNESNTELLIYSDSMGTGALEDLRVIAIVRDKKKARYLIMKQEYFMLVTDAQEHKLAEEMDSDIKRRLMAIDAEQKK